MKLTPAELRELLDHNPDTGEMHWKARPARLFKADHWQRTWNTRQAGKRAFTVSHQGYRRGMIFRRMYLEHIVAWAMHYGQWPSGQIDHINGIRDDNRISNLREATRTENCRNARMKSNNTSGVTGVVPHKGRWRAYINLHLGIFETIEEAEAARKAAERELGGYHPNHGTADRPLYPRIIRDEHGVRWSDEAKDAA
jgi:hypothetical protein